MNILKNRENKRYWKKSNEEDMGKTIMKEINRLAPPWAEVENRRIDKRKLFGNGRKVFKTIY